MELPPVTMTLFPLRVSSEGATVQSTGPDSLPVTDMMKDGTEIKF